MYQETLDLPSSGRGLHEVTAQVAAVVARSGVRIGLCHVFVQHTSASLLVQENADPSARRDLERFFERIAPEDDAIYEHAAEGPDDMPAHLRAALTATSELLPVREGRLALGTWQGIYLFEHRRSGTRRRLIVTVSG